MSVGSASTGIGSSTRGYRQHQQLEIYRARDGLGETLKTNPETDRYARQEEGYHRICNGQHLPQLPTSRNPPTASLLHLTLTPFLGHSRHIRHADGTFWRHPDRLSTCPDSLRFCLARPRAETEHLCSNGSQALNWRNPHRPAPGPSVASTCNPPPPPPAPPHLSPHPNGSPRHRPPSAIWVAYLGNPLLPPRCKPFPLCLNCQRRNSSPNRALSAAG